MLKYIILSAALIFALYFTNNSVNQSSDLTCPKVDSCQVKYDSLQKEIQELEEKVDILNKYLVIKHLEYIDVCNLKYKPKR